MPRAGLSESRIVSEAEALLDEAGPDGLTMTALAERLGVRQPSLYKHVSGTAGLNRSISLRAKRELGDTLARAAVGRAGPDAILAVAHAYRRWALAHPGRYAATQRAGSRDDAITLAAEQATVEVVADVLSGFRLAEDQMIDAIRMVRSALHGFVVLEANGGFGLPEDIDRSFDKLVEGLVRALSTWGEPPLARALST